MKYMVEFLIKKSNGTEKTKRREIITKKKEKKKIILVLEFAKRKINPGPGRDNTNTIER